MSEDKHFTGVDMKELIGGPLSAAAKASASLEKSSNLEELDVSVPRLAFIPIQKHQIDEVNIMFDKEVTQSVKSEQSSDLSASVTGTADFGIVKATISGSVSSHESNTRSSGNSAKYHVDVRPNKDATPEGLSRIMELMDESKKQRQDKISYKKGSILQLQIERDELKKQLNGLKSCLDDALLKIKNLAITQLNEYQTVHKNYMSTLERTKEEDNVKAESARTAMGEVNAAWTNFLNKAPEQVNTLALRSKTENRTVIELSGLLAYKATGSAIYDKEESQYDALLCAQASAIEAQMNYNHADLDLFSKEMEYSNALGEAARKEEASLSERLF